MNGINTTRVLLGGLAAGVVINVSEFALWALALEEQYTAMMARYGLAETSWAMVAYIGGAFVLGIALAFTYAAMRPRFGAGWSTAVAAGGVLWLVGVALPTTWNAAIGLGMGAGAMALSMVWVAVEFVVAAGAAGWVYQEEEAPAAVGARI